MVSTLNFDSSPWFVVGLLWTGRVAARVSVWSGRYTSTFREKCHWTRWPGKLINLKQPSACLVHWSWLGYCNHSWQKSKLLRLLSTGIYMTYTHSYVLQMEASTDPVQTVLILAAVCVVPMALWKILSTVGGVSLHTLSITNDKSKNRNSTLLTPIW